jgi:2-polyprenyl-3-methyl-5-hydroxy-6-metoxy-1,4-benzoquinol methylase
VLQAYAEVEDSLYLQEREGRELTFRKHLVALHRITGKPDGRRLLDVGAYVGVFVEVARATGWDAVGVEPSAWAVREAQKTGLPIRQGTLAGGGFPSESFDAVTMWDVIEHFGDPRHELEQVFRVLRLGGITAIHTIDIGSATARLMGQRWPFLMEMHIMFFSRATLRAMLAQAGFEYLGDHTQGRYLRLGYLAGRVTAAFGPLIGKPLELLVSATKLGGVPVPINTFDLFTAYARKPS